MTSPIEHCLGVKPFVFHIPDEELSRIVPPEGNRVEASTGCAVFPKEMLTWPPRSYAEHIYNIQHWTEMPRGGHFAATEDAQLLLKDIRTFGRLLRT